MCRIDPTSWDKKTGTTLLRNKLSKQQASHQVEVDLPSSSLVKADFPVNIEATIVTNAPGTRTTHIREETPTIQNSDYEGFFETLDVSNASQLLSLPHNLKS
ncbi:hypothetical protein TSUD_268800 [Trifolium subterraneum]|uniref:Uncharacterized protein n=1 Tax=Trifolium subterraneum TaxID=3900 RepID=A0A2Z6NNV3_TRISU|nr:hypothetical protein TSUD_268800 [Trifolium subterraneum]